MTSQTESDIALNLKKVFRLFAGDLEDENDENKARALAAFSDRSCENTAHALEHNMKGTGT